VKSRAFIESFTDYLPAFISITNYALGSILENQLEIKQSYIYTCIASRNMEQVYEYLIPWLVMRI
jgi:hypothetical protein